jgi:hypothetical protein
MKRLILPFFLLVLAISACRKDSFVTDTDTTDYPNPKQFVKASITGVVIDENNTPLPNVAIEVVTQSGKANLTTDQFGNFYLKDATVNALGTYIKATYPGFFHGSRTINLLANSTNQVRIQLLSNQANKTIASATGGLADYGTYSIDLPANAVVRADGSAYSGDIQIAARHLDPSKPDFGLQAPGRLEGLTSAGDITGLISMGQMAVELRGTDGGLLQLAPGKEAKLRIKVPTSSLSMAPATIPMWWFDEDAGIWIEEGTSALQNGWYEGTVKHFTFWNWDFINPSIIIDFKFVDENGQPVNNVYLDVQAQVSHTHGSGVPNLAGHLVGPVPANEPLIAYIYPLTGQGCTSGSVLLTQNLGSFTANDTVCFVIPRNLFQNPGLYTYQISGQLLDCNGAPVTNGYARVSQSLEIYPVDAQGNYSGSFTYCNPLQSMEVFGIDVAAGNTSAITSVAVTGTQMTIPTITVCTSIPQFMTLVTDIGTFSYLEPQFLGRDSLPGNTGTVFELVSNKSVNNAPDVAVGVELLNGAPKIGTFPASYARITRIIIGGGIEGYFCNNVTDCSNFTVTITKWDGPGGYVEGTYSGTLPVFGQGVPNPSFGNTFSGTFKAPL